MNKRKIFTFAKKVLNNLSLLLYKINDESCFDNTEWVVKTYRVYRFIINLVPRYSFTDFFLAYKSSIDSYLSGDNDKIQSIKSKLIDLYNKSDCSLKSYIYCIITQTDIFDSSLVEFFLQDIYRSESSEFRYWISQDISQSTFAKGIELYKNFYIDRRNTFKKIAVETFGKDHKFSKPNSKDKRVKICVLAYLLSSDILNSEQRVCSMFANNMIYYCDDVLVLCLDSTYQTQRERRKYSTNIFKSHESYEYANGISKHFTDQVHLEFARGKNYLERARSVLYTIYSYEPTIIIDLCDDYSPFSYIYSRDFFTVFEPMRVGVSSQFFDKIIATKGKYAAVNEKFNHVLSDNQALYWAFPEYVPKKIKDITKTELGISEDSFVVVTIGNNGVIEKDLIENMKHLLESDTKVFWLIVGNIALEYLKNCCKTLIDNRRIIMWGHEKNLIGLCTACDVVLRHNTTGGSGGTAIAAMQGLPVVMTNKICDASRWLGLDYSDITDEKGLIDEIKRLKSDRQYYLERQAKVRELIGKAVDSKEKWKELYDLLIKAEQEWRNHKNEQ